MAWAMGCSDASSRAPVRRRTSSASVPSTGIDVDECHAAGGDGAGLVQDDGVDLPGRFEDLGALDQDAELGAAAGPDEQRRGGGEAEGARAGDDQDGNAGGQRGGGGLAGAEPEPEGAQGEGDDDGDEDRGDLVGEPLDGCLAVLGVGDEPGDLGQGGVGADSGGPHDETAAGVDGGAGDGVAGGDLDRHRFAGEQGGVDGGAAVFDGAVGGDLLTGADDEQIADRQFADRDADLVAVANDGHVLGAQVEQGSQGSAGGALGAGFEVAAGEDEHDDHAGHLEVQLGLAGTAFEGEREAHLHAGDPGLTPEEGVDAPAERGEGADRDEGVHGGGAVAQVLPGGPVERVRRPQDHRGGHGEREPLPVLELQRVDHRDQQDRDAEDGGDDEPVAQGGELGIGLTGALVVVGGVGLGCGGDRGGVADRFDLGDDVVDGEAVGEGDGGLLGGVVHGCVDAVELVEALRDPGGARGAGHAADVEGDGRGGAGGRVGHRSHISMSGVPVTGP